MESSKLCVDVSHIIGWKGNLTGIERVEYHIIDHYYQNTDARFVSWDAASGRFRLVDRLDVKQSILDRTSESEQEAVATTTSPRKLSRISSKLKRVKQQGQAKDNISGYRIVVLAGLWDNQRYIDGLKNLSISNKLVHIVYDMIPLVRPGYVVDFLPPVFENYMVQVLPVCTGVLPISESTASDIKSVLSARKLSVPEIRSFRLGDDIVRAEKATKPKEALGCDFILSVGTIEIRKNHWLLYYVYRDLITQGMDLPPLYLVGRRGLLTSDLQHAIEHDLVVRDKIMIIDKATDSELSWMYSNCLYTVFPSFYEGWGLPIAESLAYGKVTLASNTSSMPEVGGQLADYFNPHSTTELLTQMTKYLEPQTRSKRIKQIESKYRPTDWAKASKDFAEKVDKIVS